MSNKGALKTARDDGHPQVMQSLKCSVTGIVMEEKLTEHILGLVTEEEGATLIAHTLACPSCMAKLYQLRTSLRSIRCQFPVSSGPQNLAGMDLFAEFERYADEDVPDIPTTEMAAGGPAVEAESSWHLATGAAFPDGGDSDVKTAKILERRDSSDNDLKPKYLTAPRG